MGIKEINNEENNKGQKVNAIFNTTQEILIL